MSTPYEDHPYKRIDELLAENQQLREFVDELLAENQQLRDELAQWTQTVQFLARLLGKALSQRDRARDLAVTLEGELAVLRVDG